MEKTYNGIMIDTPFSFDHTFRRHHRTTETLKPMIVYPEERRFMKWIYLDGKPYLLDAKIQKNDHGVTVVTNDKVGNHLKLEEYLNRMFGTGNSLGDFYTAFEDNEKIKRLIDQFYGMRLITNPDLFEVVVDTIIGQQINLNFAATLKERFIRFAGEIKSHEGIDLYLFPRPENVACLEYDQLQELSFSRRKAEYIIDFARNAVNKQIDLERLWEITNDEIIEELLPFRGIGRWTIECLMLFGLNRPDVLPAADIGLRNAVKLTYGLALQPRTEEVRLLAEAEGWEPWQSYITFYMWQSLKDAK